MISLTTPARIAASAAPGSVPGVTVGVSVGGASAGDFAGSLASIMAVGVEAPVDGVAAPPAPPPAPPIAAPGRQVIAMPAIVTGKDLPVADPAMSPLDQTPSTDMPSPIPGTAMPAMAANLTITTSPA